MHLKTRKKEAIKIRTSIYNILKKIQNYEAKIGIIGLGYVGLPFSIEIAKAGYEVFGLDIDQFKIIRLLASDSYIGDVNWSDLDKVIKNGKFNPTSDFSIIKELDAVIICVPTPLTKSREPDMSYIISTVEQIKKYMHKGLLIILESTTYPGTTEELIENELAKMEYRVGEDYFLCFSPERIDPGNKQYNIKNIPKVIGGTTSKCTELGAALYNNVIDKLVTVSSPKVAEMSKLLENTFRSINIAFINEMAMLCDRLGIDIWETIEAASSKPFGYMRFTPGPGIGGHCIPIDPMYLSWKAKDSNFNSRFIELAQEVNKNMPSYVLNKVGEALNNVNKIISSSKILILGMVYKPDVDDLRESPSLEIYELLQKNGALVQFNDPYAKKIIDQEGNHILSIDLNYNDLMRYDCILLLTNHESYNYNEIVKNANLIIDTRNAFKGINSSKIIKIGAPLL
ncbi:nucleotide sugar dehydrogenase [Peribacillus sp. V2I11]|uniref:nucleotide sugar dehydrogenase n=1 Tax=Peribacillus sp. V2I11 TaxID=3042277 RepID=UPI0027D7D563|nr:nucleotide sugar dehydrogenase [Peribacillus sp. V2I11]